MNILEAILSESPIELVKNSTLNIIEQTILLINELLEESSEILLNEDSFSDDASNTINRFRLDRTSFLNLIETLKNEESKVSRLELVLAFMGAMKAGKSTLINSIIGTEVLPHRSHPMTMLPTLIRHNEARIEPVLLFNNKEPLEKLCKRIINSLLEHHDAKTLSSLDMYGTPNGKELIDRLIRKRNYCFSDEYLGSEAIFDFLWNINDLVRLSHQLGIEPPYQDYQNLEQLPTIEIAFQQLNQFTEKNKATKGSFAILDTPGPNEFRQSDSLREIFDAQLQRASGVILVIDYTQLNSNAEVDIRQSVMDLSLQLDDRLFVAVNKFDNKDANSMDENGVKEYVSEQLLSSLDSERVFPLSGRYAYLASRALRELKIHNLLPDVEREKWVEDFYKQAFGASWKVLLPMLKENSELLNASTQNLWNQSLLDNLLEKSIQKAYNQSALLSLRSCIDKLLFLFGQIGDYLTVRGLSLTKETKTLRSVIEILEVDQESVSRAMASSDERFGQLIQDFTDVSNHHSTATTNTAKELLSEYFSTGKKISNNDIFEMLNQKLSIKEVVRKMWSGLKRFFSGPTYNTPGELDYDEEQDFDPDSRTMLFKSKEEGALFVEKLQYNLESMLTNLRSQYIKLFSQLQSTFVDEVEAEISKYVGQVLANARNELKREFNIDLRLPDIAGELSQEFSLKKPFRTPPIVEAPLLRRAWWFIKQNWDESVKGAKFTLDLDYIESKFDEIIQKQNETAQHEGVEVIEQLIKPKIDDYFEELRDYLQRYKDVLLQSIDDKKNSFSEQQKLKKKIDKYLVLIRDSEKELDRIKSSVSQLF